jgi:predicted Ser/Thr protein kinase
VSRSLAQTALRWHTLVFVLINGFLGAINLAVSPSTLWFLWVTGAWGMALALHAFGALSGDPDQPSEPRSRRRSSRGADESSSATSSSPSSAPTIATAEPQPFSSAPTEHATPRPPNAPPPPVSSERQSVLQSGQRVAGRFIIERALGAGGMGEVYVAHDSTLDETVALKTIASSLVGTAAVDRFRREAQAARRITHPNVVRIHDIGQDGALSFISMEYVEGESLGERLERDGALPVSEIKRIAMELCAGLQAAHHAGVTHRDLKPDNVLLDRKGKVRVIDFGLASVDTYTGLTATGAVMGTPGYMAPEQVLGKEADARTDIYAVGCILYHALAGVPPFARDSAIAVGFAHCYDLPTSLATHRTGLDSGWDALVMRTLAKDPDQRFQSATELRDAIDQLAS